MKSQNDTRKHRRIVYALIVLACLIGAAFLFSNAYGRMRYPLRYTDLIQENADRFGLDPYRVAAVIKTESDFDAEAVSRAGAMGLMQIMPETGSWIAEKLGVADFRPAMLLEPECNITFGCWYLRFLDERFGGDPDLMAAAYNAGHNKVSSWLEDESVSGDGEHLQDIPYPETRDYVKRIAGAYEHYRRLWPDSFR